MASEEPNRQERPASASAGADRERGGAADPGKTILLADDDEVVRSFVARVLSYHGYGVISARDGQEAVDLFETRRAAVAMAVLDVAMPRLDGRSAAERMRAIRPSLPVLLCTGHDFQILGRGAALGPGMEVLRKPFTHDDLLRRVRAMLGSGTVTLPEEDAGAW
jgi:DNA-binding response OmpR family regulator